MFYFAYRHIFHIDNNPKIKNMVLLIFYIYKTMMLDKKPGFWKTEPENQRTTSYKR